MDEGKYWINRDGRNHELHAEKLDTEYHLRFVRERPSILLRPGLSIDGNQWCALYGENIQDGVAGFGSSPEKAYEDFDRAWRESLDGKK